MTHHPEDLASVTAANRDRLMGVAAAISTITNSERHMIDLADLEAKARAATHGEWSVLTSRLDSTRSIMAGDPAFFLARCHKSPVSDATANATYIVAAQPSVVLELIERIRAAEAKAGEPVAATHRHKKRGTEIARPGGDEMSAHEKAVVAAAIACAEVPPIRNVDQARAAITAYLTTMREQGWVMVPKTPSDEMLVRGGNKYADPYSAMQEDVIAAGLIYRAMLDAATLAAKEE